METRTFATTPNPLGAWGLVGAVFAVIFAIWLLFFPDLVAPYFAWDVHPRLAQVFVGAGYVFRAAFFLAVWRVREWHRVRWLVWGNLAFTGTLLLATFWHADAFKWDFPLSTGHLWLFLYVSEPAFLIYRMPRGAAANYPAPPTGGPISSVLKVLLVAEACFLFALGALLVINPTFANQRWPWALNPLDARITAAWLWGWTVWAGTMAFAHDWDEIRLPLALNVFFGVTLGIAVLVYWGDYNFTRITYLGFCIGLTIILGFFYWRQERARPARAALGAPAPSPAT